MASRISERPIENSCERILGRGEFNGKRNCPMSLCLLKTGKRYQKSSTASMAGGEGRVVSGSTSGSRAGSGKAARQRQRHHRFGLRNLEKRKNSGKSWRLISVPVRELMIADFSDLEDVFAKPRLI